MALELGKSVNEYFGWAGPLTHRQHLTWVSFLQERWNHPGTVEHYLMQLTLHVNALPYRAWGLEEPDVGLDDFKIPFKWARGEEGKRAAVKTPEQERAEDVAFRSQAGLMYWQGVASAADRKVKPTFKTGPKPAWLVEAERLEAEGKK